MFNSVLLVAIIATWILKVTSLPKLYFQEQITNTVRNMVFGQDTDSLIISKVLKMKFTDIIREVIINRDDM